MHFLSRILNSCDRYLVNESNMQKVLDMVQKNRETGINRSLVIRLYEHILLGGVTFTHKQKPIIQW